MTTAAVSTEGLTGYEQRRVWRKDRDEINRRATAALIARHKGEMSQDEYDELSAIYDAELERLRPLCRRPRSEHNTTTGTAEPFEFEF